MSIIKNIIDKLKKIYKKRKSLNKIDKYLSFYLEYYAYHTHEGSIIINKNYDGLLVIVADNIFKSNFISLLYKIINNNNNIIVTMNEPLRKTGLNILKLINVQYHIKEFKLQNYLVVEIDNIEHFLKLFDLYFEWMHIFSFDKQKVSINEIVQTAYDYYHGSYDYYHGFKYSIIEDSFINKVEFVVDIYSGTKKFTIQSNIFNLIKIYKEIITSCYDSNEIINFDMLKQSNK